MMLRQYRKSSPIPVISFVYLYNGLCRKHNPLDELLYIT